MPGPLPNPQRRRRNTPTIATNSLPAAGRQEKAPRSPYKLEKAGRAWWRWAWSLPQATRWDAGALYALARRAQLEDDLAAIDLVDHLDLQELLATALNDSEDQTRSAIRDLEFAIRRLKGLAGGRVALMREMRELDARFGLTAKSMLDLRWTIGDVPADDDERAAPVTPIRRLAAVDPQAS